jgi:hypothetical protein
VVNGPRITVLVAGLALSVLALIFRQWWLAGLFALLALRAYADELDAMTFWHILQRSHPARGGYCQCDRPAGDD